MIATDLDENDDVVLVSDKLEAAEKNSKGLQFRRKLILQVRKQRSLYDCKHKLYSNVAKKDLVWQQIANKLKSDVDTCKETWFELRYNYQRHARKLRNYFIQDHKENRKRPAMALESELMFLWRVVDNRKTCEIQFEISENENPEEVTDKKTFVGKETTATTTTTLSTTEKDNIKTIDDDLIIVEPPVELIVIDEDDDNSKPVKQFKLNTTMKKLIEHIKTHPEIFDSKHKDFLNYSRKSFLWNAIASNMGDKATKLMKCWIVMQTRYEWEICQTDQTAYKESELQVEFKFFKEFILKNPSTVYKQSHFLKYAWYDPIEYFKDIYNLIVRMKKMSDIVNITDSLLQTPKKSKQYITLWTDIASLKNTSPGQCETTWLIMRYFYWELMNMREENYQLTDKWYFETIITELYAIYKTSQAAKQLDLQMLKSNKQNRKRPAQSSANKQIGPPNKCSSSSSISTPTQMNPTIINNFQNVSPSSATLPNQSSVEPTALMLPKITGAISLSPHSLNSGSLQIKQIPGPPALSPAPFQLNNSANTTVRTATTSQNTQMSTMSFNLPTKTRVTPILMPSLTPLVPNNVRNPVPATISVRPQSQLKIASWATPPIEAVKPANVVTQMHNQLQPTNQNSFSAAQVQPNIHPLTTNPTTPITPIFSPSMPFNQQTSQLNIYRSKTTFWPPSTNSAQSVASSPTLPTKSSIPSLLVPLNNSNIPAESYAIASSPQVPTIAGAISLLNPNEILIELIASQNGNLLVVHGPPLTAKYQLTMTMLAKFIREILSIPMLHNQQRCQIDLINFYWDHISQMFNLPVHICRAVWNFLLENFDHFPRIAPMKELMKPFQSKLKVWKESDVFFKQFDDISLRKGWLEYSKSFPEVVEYIGTYPVLYQDVGKEKKPENEMETLCVWRTIGLRFPKHSNILNIWSNLKTCFVRYMTDLEIGIDNKWSSNWWRSLARMKFLVEAKYTTTDPFYYIISNKMLEQIDKFATLEMRNRLKTATDETVIDETVTDETVTVETATEETATDETVTDETVTDKTVDKTINVELEIMASGISSKDKKIQVEVITLLTAIQKYPIIFTRADSIKKYEAWQKVGRELGMKVPCCLLAFKKSIENYLAYKKRDPVNRLPINEKYYKKFEEIIHSMPISKLASAVSGKINVKTPFELNQVIKAENSMESFFPERFISDINMSTRNSNLVVKNWVYAIGNIPNFSDSASLKVRHILKKYLPKMKF